MGGKRIALIVGSFFGVLVLLTIMALCVHFHYVWAQEALEEARLEARTLTAELDRGENADLPSAVEQFDRLEKRLATLQSVYSIWLTDEDLDDLERKLTLHKVHIAVRKALLEAKKFRERRERP